MRPDVVTASRRSIPWEPDHSWDGGPTDKPVDEFCLNASTPHGHDAMQAPSSVTPVSSRYLTFPARWVRPSSQAAHDVAQTPRAFSLETLYAEHRQALWSFALRMLADAAAAEDLVHDVFVTLPSLWHKVQPHTPIRSFLLGVTANLARNHARSARRRQQLGNLWGKQATGVVAEHPEFIASQRDCARQLERALATLSHDHRVVFVLVEVEQHSPLEAAEILDLPPGTVRSRLFHAKRQLQSLLWGKEPT